MNKQKCYTKKFYGRSESHTGSRGVLKLEIINSSKLRIFYNIFFKDRTTTFIMSSAEHLHSNIYLALQHLNGHKNVDCKSCQIQDNIHNIFC